jgi:hypothetical protein
MELSAVPLLRPVGAKNNTTNKYTQSDSVNNTL